MQVAGVYQDCKTNDWYWIPVEGNEVGPFLTEEEATEDMIAKKGRSE